MKRFLESKFGHKFLLIVILSLGVFFRFYGLNWDQGYHLHPDERFLTMVETNIKIPESLGEYLNPEVSPLNPYNRGYNFFVYGTLPLFLTKAVGLILKMNDYQQITLVGRILSALFDLGTLVLVILIARKIFPEKKIISLLSGFFYTISVLPIQLSHFFAVDTFLVFFLTLSFYLLIEFLEKPKLQKAIFLGVSFGLALACKASGLLFLPIIILGGGFYLLKKRDYKLFTVFCLLIFVFTYLSFRIAQPYAFFDRNLLNIKLNPQFVGNLKTLKSFDDPKNLFPPGVQWIPTKPIIFPLKNMILWGLGLPLGILALSTVVLALKKSTVLLVDVLKSKGLTLIILRQARDTSPKDTEQSRSANYQLLLTIWIILLFFYQGIQFAKPMRYFYPIYPFLAIFSAQFLYQWINSLRQRFGSPFILYSLYSIHLLPFLIWPLAFISIYSKPHPRIIASKWIYANIQAGSTISCEYWDDCLPLPIGDKSSNIYQTETLHLYDSDTEEKWKKINRQLERIDYMVLSSNRLWGSIPKVPEKYPITARFYQNLFAGNLNFKKVAEITSYPTIPILNIQIPDDSADESFTVYDHPKVMIFQKMMEEIKAF